MKRRFMTWAPVVVIVAVVVALSGCGGGSSRTPTSQRMRLEITSPTARGSVTDAEVTIAGVISEPSAAVTVDGVAVDVAGDGSFTRTVPLAYGSNRFPIRAMAAGCIDTCRTVTITRNLTLDGQFPANDITVSQNRTTVTGSVSDPTATVRVQGHLVPVNEDGAFSHDPTLYYPSTILAITASIADREPISRTVTVSCFEAQQ